MKKEIKEIMLQGFLLGAKKRAVDACVTSIQTAVKTNQPEIQQFARNALGPYLDLLILEDHIKGFGLKTRCKYPILSRTYDHVRPKQLHKFLDDATNDILDQKGITLE